jgi:hypothetical protein
MERGLAIKTSSITSLPKALSVDRHFCKRGLIPSIVQTTTDAKLIQPAQTRMSTRHILGKRGKTHSLKPSGDRFEVPDSKPVVFNPASYTVLYPPFKDCHL